MRLRNILLAVAVAAFGFSAPTFAGVADTVHNLGTSGSGNGPNGGARNSFSGTGEVCVFCHTPHGGDTSAVVPLWNRTLSASSIYTTYDQLGTTTLDGEVTNVGSVSIACLSCHDGTQAMDSVINEPGSGAVVASFSTSGSWSGADVTGTGEMSNVIQMLGTDLTNDHPVGIQYGGGGINSGATLNTTTDPDFFGVSHETVNGKDVWWVDSEAAPNGTRQKTDVILYTRTDFTSGLAEPSVECASCHDPHGTNNATFLRVTEVGSGICLTCHNK